jgi:hypothetical protein
MRVRNNLALFIFKEELIMEKKEIIELNSQAREMMRTGNFEGIRTLAKGKGIADSVIDDFILGECLILDDSKDDSKEAPKKEDKTEEPMVNVIVPFYKSIEEKLEQEQEELLKGVKEEKQKAFIKKQLKDLVEYILSDNDLKAKAFQNWKELSRCYSSITDKAKEYAISGVACISGNVVLGWIKEYYDLDDQKQVEEERIKEAIAAKKAEERKKEAEAKKKATRKPRKTKAEKEKEEKAEAEAKAEAEVKADEPKNEETVNMESKEDKLDFELDPSLV